VASQAATNTRLFEFGKVGAGGQLGCGSLICQNLEVEMTLPWPRRPMNFESSISSF
jgi:hypothetical protein